MALADSLEWRNDDTPAGHVLDGDEDTLWHSAYENGPLPHEVIVRTFQLHFPTAHTMPQRC